MSLRARWLGPLILLVAAPAALRAEVTRTLRAQLPGAANRPVAVENLLGKMRVTAGSADALVVVATVHAEDDALASSVRLEEVRGDGGVATLRVRYPATSRVLRYPRRNGDEGSRIETAGGRKDRYN